jgi:iron complex outermembrane receptor protein
MNYHALRRLTLLATVATFVATPAFGQSDPAPQESPLPDGSVTPREAKDSSSVLLGDIVVTANRRSENLQRVGISVTAFSGEAMAKLGFATTTDIVKQTPAVSFYQFSPSVSNINIRGVVQNDFADHLEPPIAVYQDDTYIGSSGGISVPMFDMERVEVLRGPQGTLFGRNATGGLMHFISAAPTKDLSGYIQGSYGRFQTWNVQGAISGPISDNVLGRLSFSRNKGDSPFRNTVTGRRDAGDTDNIALRGQLLFNIGDNTELRLLGRYNNDDQHGPMYSIGVATPGADGLGVPVGPNQTASFPNIVTGGTVTAPCAGCNVVGYRDRDGSPWSAASSYPGYFKRNIYDGQIKLTHDFGGVTLTSVTDYLKINKDLLYDTDGSPAQFFVYGTTQRFKQFSQELRFNGETDSLKWVAGGYYLNMRGKYGSTVDLDLAPYVGAPLCIGASCPPGGTVPAHFQTDYTLKTTSFAFFAQGEYALSDIFSLIAGARFTHDNKKYNYAFTDTPAIQAPFTYTPASNDNADRSFDNVSAKIELDYKPDTTTLIYASITRGHKGGNWTAPVFPPIDPSVFAHKQEVLTSYEAGLKKRFLNGMATFNASAFYYDYHNYQAFSLINIAQSISNVDATVYGGEAELKLAPARGLDLAFNASTVHSKVKGIILPNGQAASRDLPNTPKISLSGLARYSFDFSGGSLAAQASSQYKSGYYLTTLNEPVNREKRWATVDLRLSWTSPDDKLELAVYGDNITSTKYRVWALDVSSLSLGMQVYAPPATYGASARYRF